MPLIEKLRDRDEMGKGCRSNPISPIIKSMVLSVFFAVILSLLPAGAPIAADVYSGWTGGADNWSVKEKWDPPEVPDNGAYTYWVSISGYSSIVTLDMNAAIEGLDLGSAAELLINEKHLKVVDGGSSTPSTITNNGGIYLKGTTGADSRLVIEGNVGYKGNGTILFDDNILHGIEGGDATTGKLLINESTTMDLQGVTPGGGQGILGGGLILENYGTVTLNNFNRFDLFAPTSFGSWWVNKGVIQIQADSEVNLKGYLHQIGETLGKLSISGVLNLQNAYVYLGRIEGAGKVNGVSLTLNTVKMDSTDFSIDSLTILGSNEIPSIHFDTGAVMYVDDSAWLKEGTDWDFATGESESTIRRRDEGDRLTLFGTHTFTGGTVKVGDSTACLQLSIPEQSELIVSNVAEFNLCSTYSLIYGSIRAQNGGLANLNGAWVAGLVGADDGSTLEIGSNTVVEGSVTTNGTGRIKGCYGTLKGANVNGHILLDPRLKMGGDISGNFTVHFNSPTVGSQHYLETISGGAHLESGTMELRFESPESNYLSATDEDPFTINSGAILKLSGSGKGSLTGLINKGAIVASGLNSGWVWTAENDGTISVTNNSTLELHGNISNEKGSFSVDSSSKIDVFSLITGGRFQGPAEPQVPRTVSAMDGATDGAFVGRGGTLQDVTNSATIVVPEGEQISIKNSFSNEGLLMIEGGTVKVVLTSQTTTLDGGGEILLTGGDIRGPDSGTVKDLQFINEDNTIRGNGTIYDYYGYDISLTNRGVIKADQDTQLWLETGVTNEGKIEALGAGGLKASEIINKGEVKVTAGSRLDVPRIIQQSGSFQATGDLLDGENPVGYIEVSGGTFFGGNAAYNLAINGGTFRIGNGKFNVNYTYSQGPNGILAVGLGGYNPGVDHGLLLTNTAGSQFSSTNLDGTVIITTASDFEPKPGDEFTFLRSQGFGGLNGKFAKVINATPYALNFELVYDISTVTLRVSSLPTLYVAKDGVCGGNAPCYSTIQAAVNAASNESNESVIKIAQGTYNESPTLNQSRSLILKGGWNTSYTTQTPNTTIIKSPKAPQGSLRIQEVTIRP